MKKGLTAVLICILTISTLLFSGCAKGGSKLLGLKVGNTSRQISNTSSTNTNTVSKDVKSITDNELIKSAEEDSPVQLDSMDSQSQELTSDDIDTLLDDNSVTSSIPSDFSVR